MNNRQHCIFGKAIGKHAILCLFKYINYYIIITIYVCNDIYIKFRRSCATWGHSDYHRVTVIYSSTNSYGVVSFPMPSVDA